MTRQMASSLSALARLTCAYWDACSVAVAVLQTFHSLQWLPDQKRPMVTNEVVATTLAMRTTCTRVVTCSAVPHEPDGLDSFATMRPQTLLAHRLEAVVAVQLSPPSPARQVLLRLQMVGKR